MADPETVDLFHVYHDGDEVPDWEQKADPPSPTPTDAHDPHRARDGGSDDDL
jgi:hypothetical protein